MSLIQKIESRQARIAVIGLGYVGLPSPSRSQPRASLSSATTRARKKVDSVRRGISYIKDVPEEALAPHVKAGRITATTDPACLAQADAVVICVPTPLNKSKAPDNGYIIAAAADLLPHLHRDMLVVLESTTFPGFTREVLLPRLRESGLQPGKTSTWPSRQSASIPATPASIREIPQGHRRHHAALLAGGAGFVSVLHRALGAGVLDGCGRDGEAPENTFRAVNIGLANELALMCQKLGLDTWEVIEAAATKPFGFMPFIRAGLGRTLHPRRSTVSVVEAAHPEVRSAVHRSRRSGQHRYARVRRRACRMR